jgi:hypothetical protein
MKALAAVTEHSELIAVDAFGRYLMGEIIAFAPRHRFSTNI